MTYNLKKIQICELKVARKNHGIMKTIIIHSTVYIIYYYIKQYYIILCNKQYIIYRIIYTTICIYCFAPARRQKSNEILDNRNDKILQF